MIRLWIFLFQSASDARGLAYSGVAVTQFKGSISVREPDSWLPRFRKAAGKGSIPAREPPHSSQVSGRQQARKVPNPDT